MVVAGCIAAGGSIVSGIIGMGAASSAERRAAQDRARLQAQLTSLENSRQAVINPYSEFKDVSGLATNLSGMISNPYANLGVATKAAEFQAEQEDISLANTLDTLKQTGASAGGATALAQAALQSKKAVSADIESQEAQNEKLRAQGEQQLQQMKMAEAQRIQGLQISEAQRMQQAGAAGKEFMFNATETRQNQQLNRVAGQLQGAEMQQAQANANYTGALTGMIGGLTSAAGSYMSAYGQMNTGVVSGNQTNNTQGYVGNSAATNNPLPGNAQSYGPAGTNWSPQSPSYQSLGPGGTNWNPYPSPHYGPG